MQKGFYFIVRLCAIRTYWRYVRIYFTIFWQCVRKPYFLFYVVIYVCNYLHTWICIYVSTCTTILEDCSRNQ